MAKESFTVYEIKLLDISPNPLLGSIEDTNSYTISLNGVPTEFDGLKYDHYIGHKLTINLNKDLENSVINLKTFGNLNSDLSGVIETSAVLPTSLAKDPNALLEALPTLGRVPSSIVTFNGISKEAFLQFFVENNKIKLGVYSTVALWLFELRRV